MGYALADDLINDVAAYYNDTDAINFNLSPATKRRMLFYVQRTVDEIWYYRPWAFKMNYLTVQGADIVGGAYALPFNFATVGSKGGLFEQSNHTLWTEVDFQEWMVLRQRGNTQQVRWYTIGNLSAQGEGVVQEDPPITGPVLGAGTAGQPKRSLLFPSPTEARTFDLYYEGSPPAVALGAAIPTFDEAFHHVILQGTVAKLQEAKGDPRPIFRSEYIAALSKAAAQHQPLTSRMQQMPRALPGGMW